MHWVTKLYGRVCAVISWAQYFLWIRPGGKADSDCLWRTVLGVISGHNPFFVNLPLSLVLKFQFPRIQADSFKLFVLSAKWSKNPMIFNLQCYKQRKAANCNTNVTLIIKLVFSQSNTENVYIFKNEIQAHQFSLQTSAQDVPCLFSLSALPNLENFILKYQLLFTDAKTFPIAYSALCCFFLTSSLTLT